MLAAYLATSTIFKWGSACSGTESPHWVFQALASAAVSRMVFEQVYSAELDPHKRAWIMDQAKPKCLFSDIFDVTRATARCCIRGLVNVKEVCHSSTTDLFIAGFSCQTVSGLNPDDATRMRAISNYEGTTGITWWGVCQIVQKTHPRAFILENVQGLMRYNSHLAVVEKLRSFGYIVLWRLCDALECGLPQHRPRIYFIGWLRAGVADADYFAGRMGRVLEQLLANHPRMDIDDFLFDEDDANLMKDTDEKIRKQDESIDRPAGGGTKWIEKNKLMCKKKKGLAVSVEVVGRTRPDVSGVPALE